MKITPIKHLLFFAIMTAAFSCSSKVITIDNSRKAAIEFEIGSKAIVFAENTRKKNTGVLSAQHKRTSDSIYSLFQGATDDFFVGRTNAQTFRFKTDKKSWFANTLQLKNANAMIIFDGVSKPSIEYNPKNYLPIVMKRFPIELAKKQNSRTKKVYKNKTAEVALSLLLSTSFKPGKHYVANLIANANTIDYPIAPSEDDFKNYGQLKTIGYTDSTQKYIQYITTTTFNDDATGRIKSTTTDFKDVYKSVLNNYYGANGLMDSSTTYVDGKRNYSKKYKYLHDRFIFWDERGNWSEFLLNNKMQVIKRTDYNEDNSFASMTIYSHDERGRIIKEENFNKYGEIRDTQVYSYTGNSKTFTENKRVDPQGKTESAIIRIKEGNKITQNAIFNGKIASSHIYEFNKDGTGYTKTYVDGKMTSFTLTRRS